MNAPLLLFASVSSWVIGWCASLTLARGGGNRCDAQSLTLLDGACLAEKEIER